jgi:DNA-binding response OmpR family regulator
MKKILIVDDDSDLLFGLNALLTNKGYEIRTLDEGGTAIPVIQEFHPDIILLDVNLPGMDGRKICKLIKHNSTTMHIPVIMISANADRKDDTDCLTRCPLVLTYRATGEAAHRTASRRRVT